MAYCTYAVCNILNKKIYVGWTKNGVFYRWQWGHCWEAFHGSKLRFHRAIKKYGPENFLVITLATVKSEKEAKFLESFWILNYRSYLEEFGYNMTMGG